MSMNTPPDLKTIRQVHERIAPFIHRTPVLTSAFLNTLTEATLFFKGENFQKAGAFKSRGAVNAVFSLSESEAACGVVTHSSGNHAGALARAASLRNIPAHIVMPSTAPRVKVEAVKSYGGQITFCQPTLAAREAAAEKIVKAIGATLIHPYDDWRIIAGQATGALELMEQVPNLDALLTPLGGGGLLSGTLLSVKATDSRIQVIGCEPAMADDAWRSLQAGHILPSENPQTVADGLLTSLGARTFQVIQEKVDAIGLAPEEAILPAMRLLWERMKIVVEPSSAVPLACLLSGTLNLKGKRVGIILSGGNVDLEKVKTWF